MSNNGDGVDSSDAATLLISQSTITNNNGAGINSGNGAVWVRAGSVIARNSAWGIGSGSLAGNTGDTLLITDSSVSDNREGIEAGGSTLVVKRSTISGNYDSSQSGLAGGIWVLGRLKLVNSTVTDNTSADVGGICLFGGDSLTILNSTITNNHLLYDGHYAGCGNGPGGAGISIGSIFGGTNPGTWQNTIVLGNFGGPECTYRARSSHPSGDHNLFSNDGSCHTVDDTTNRYVDPASAGLDRLGDYGGPTQTVRLQPGSPAIGAGNAEACAAVPVDGVDQRGLPRPLESCDIGAYDTNGDTQSFTNLFTPGWQLISVPLMPTTPLSASTVLTGLLQSSHGEIAAIYSLTNDQWSPSLIDLNGVQTGNDFALQVGKGYLLYCDRAGSYTETGTVPPGAPVWLLSAGWNLVGPPRGTPSALAASMVLDDVLDGSARAQLAAIYGLTNDRWSPSLIDFNGSQFGNDFALQEGRGYLLYTDQSGVVAPGAPTIRHAVGQPRSGSLSIPPRSSRLPGLPSPP